MKRIKIVLFACMLLFSFPKTVWAQVTNTADSTDDDSEVVDPDYKPLTRSGNTVNGKWYGIGNVVTTGYSNSYLCELLLKEDKKGNVTGYFNYFFRDGYFSNKLVGSYDKSAQTFKFKPVIVLFHQTVKADIGVDVPMYGNFILNLNSKDTTLTGFLTPVSNYKYLVPALNMKLSIVGKGEPTLKERIRKRKLELEEDADVATVLNESKKDSVKLESPKNIVTAKEEPQNKVYKNDVVKNNGASTSNYKNDTVRNNSGKSTQYKNDIVKAKESSNNYKNDVIKTNDVAKGSVVKNDIVKNDATTKGVKSRDTISFKDGLKKVYQSDTIRPRNNIAAKGRDTIRFSTIQRNYQRDTLKFNQQLAAVNQAMEQEYKRRTTNLFNTLVVRDDSVTVSLYDNGEFDHDMVSVFFNGKLVASNIELKTNAATKFVVYLDLTPGAKNELTLFAENLGTIPPNSALMIIEDTHNNRYEVNLKSDLSHNASVLLTPKLQ